MQNPLLIQELVDECLSYLFASDLRACALVNKSWSHAAQRSIFGVVSVPRSLRVWKRLDRILHASSHLGSNIHTLILWRDTTVNIELFENICNLHFPCLQIVSIHLICVLTAWSAQALQRLLSLPTVRQVEMDCNFTEYTFQDFHSIWDECSPDIRRLRLRCHGMALAPLHPLYSFQRRTSPPITLESLKVDPTTNIDDWLNHDLCPFDLSQLVSLSGCSMPMFSWPRLTSALQTIETLEFVLPSLGTAVVDLSSFPNLKFFRLRVHPLERALDNLSNTLSTIPPSSRIRQIVFCLDTPQSSAFQLIDFKVAALQMQHLEGVGLEMDADRFAQWAPYCHRLGMKNLLCRTDPDWFEHRLSHTAG
ncbi:hypothetical protein MSAN_01445900 [Mycena sanguinolenta]|uniref:F-box domain-containing protein n=1 Tax=Mycena sanguinolenta TaxID=230812 RepID=A0A8H6YC08_9AGAR|nr:hypothetical protein MSAN_01445900 [Mycena sanguinolenta]